MRPPWGLPPGSAFRRPAGPVSLAPPGFRPCRPRRPGAGSFHEVKKKTAGSFEGGLKSREETPKEGCNVTVARMGIANFAALHNATFSHCGHALQFRHRGLRVAGGTQRRPCPGGGGGVRLAPSRAPPGACRLSDRGDIRQFRSRRKMS